jgi:hypothetical protein
MSAPAQPPAQPDPAQHLLQLATGYIVSGCLQIAAKLKVADQLASGPRSVHQLAAASHVNEDALYRVVRALSMVGVFQETAPRTFALTPVGEMMRSDRPGLYNMALWISSPYHFKTWSEVMHSMTTGQPSWEVATGLPVFDYFAKNQELSAIFNGAMTAFSAMILPAVLEAYDFSGVHTLVDVAGGHGATLTGILQKYPSMRGILFDLDHVVAGAGPQIAEANCADRCEVVSGDFFTAVPEGDAYVLQHIIHDWDDERATTILRTIHKALTGRPQGRVLLIEGVIEPGNAPDFHKLIDLEMLVVAGGRERSADEYRALFAGAGFELARIVPTKSPVSVIEGRPR